MSRTLGTVARGVRTPIFREGDNVVEGVVSSVLTALKENGIQPHDKDVAAVTESVVARCQGNYATVEQIAADVKAKTGGKTVGVTFPILSRNRFSLLLSGIAAGVEKVVLMLSYPSDEVGNHLVSLDQLDEAGIDPWHDVLDLEQFRAAFGKVIHPFTGVDYVDFYKGIIEDAGAQAEIVFANRVQTVLDYTDTVICCDIHTRQRSKRLLKKAGARVVLGLDDLLTAPVNGSGYNPQYGLLAAIRPTTPVSSSSPVTPTWWPRPSAGGSARPPASASRPWSTATAPLRIPWARFGSWRIPWSPPAIPPVWRVHPMS